MNRSPCKPTGGFMVVDLSKMAAIRLGLRLVRLSLRAIACTVCQVHLLQYPVIVIVVFWHLSRRMSKPTKWRVRPAKSQISLGIRPVWSESSLSVWRNIGPLTTYWAHSEDSDQTGRMPWGWSQYSLGANIILLVLSDQVSRTLVV